MEEQINSSFIKLLEEGGPDALPCFGDGLLGDFGKERLIDLKHTVDVAEHVLLGRVEKIENDMEQGEDSLPDEMVGEAVGIQEGLGMNKAADRIDDRIEQTNTTHSYLLSENK